MWFSALVVRTRTDPAALARAVKAAVYTVDPDQALSAPETMDQVIANSVARPRLGALLVGVFAGLALLLAAVGLYGVLAYSVTQRTREFGIRLAIGSQPWHLVMGVVWQGALMAAGGVAVGALGGYALANLAGSYINGMQMPGAVPVAGSAAVLLAAALVASLVPAARAARVDVMQALRSD